MTFTKIEEYFLLELITDKNIFPSAARSKSGYALW
jgi:hypothetical protein